MDIYRERCGYSSRCTNDGSRFCGSLWRSIRGAGKVRVGLVVDFGIGEIAPAGETPREFFSDCVVVPEGSVGLDVVESVLDVRVADSGLICASPVIQPKSAELKLI